MYDLAQMRTKMCQFFLVLITFLSLPFSLVFGQEETPPSDIPFPPGYLSPFQDGTLVKGAGDHRVYHIIKGKRHWIPSPEAFKSYKFDWQKIKEVDSGVIVSLPRVYLIKLQNDVRVYYITESGIKKHILNEKIFHSYDNHWEDIVEVSKVELDSYSDLRFIRKSGDYRVYLIEGDTKRHIINPSVFERFGSPWSQILEINETEFNEYETRDPLY